MSGDETVLVIIQRVTEGRTRPNWKNASGNRRWEIDALRVADGSNVWCSTLDVLKASLCDRSSKTGRQLLLTIRMVTLHGRFGSASKVYNLVSVEQPTEELSA